MKMQYRFLKLWIKEPLSASTKKRLYVQAINGTAEKGFPRVIDTVKASVLDVSIAHSGLLSV